MKKFWSSILFIFTAGNATAADSSVVYNSPILVLLFVGFCALIIVAQLIPAVLALFGLTKAIKPRAKIHS